MSSLAVYCSKRRKKKKKKTEENICLFYLSPFIKKSFPLFFHTLSQPGFFFFLLSFLFFLFFLIYLSPVPHSPFFSLSCFGFVENLEIIIWVSEWVCGGGSGSGWNQVSSCGCGCGWWWLGSVVNGGVVMLVVVVVDFGYGGGFRLF